MKSLRSSHAEFPKPKTSDGVIGAQIVYTRQNFTNPSGKQQKFNCIFLNIELNKETRNHTYLS
jgi:hypothetical protein